MKLIFVLVLSGVAYSTASPTCSEEELDKCFKPHPKSDNEAFRETEEFLDYQCGQFRCSIDYQKRCGLPDVSPGKIALYKQYGIIYDALCEKNNPMRRKYLENARCIQRQTENISSKCHIRDGLEFPDPDFCPDVVAAVKCSHNFIREECGKDAGEVYEAIFPGVEFFGC